MAVTFTSNLGDGTVTGVSSITQSVTVPSYTNGILIVVYSNTIWVNTHTCTIDGDSATNVHQINVGGTGISMWYEVSPAEGTYNVVGLNNGANAAHSIGVLLFEGVDVGDPFLDSGDEAGNAAATTIAVTVTGGDGGMGVATGMNYGESSIGIGAGETEVFENLLKAGQGRHNAAYEARTNSDDYALTVTAPTTSEIAVIGLTLKQSVGGVAASQGMPAMFFSLAGLTIPAATLAGLYKSGAVAL